jgi:ribosomal protein S18 acetylase RimI-like enzyme
MDFIIVMAEDEKEISGVHQTMLEAFKEYDRYDIPSSAMNESVASIQQAIQKGEEKAILCCMDEKPLGSVRFMLDHDSIYFKRLSVSPKARGMGMARAMIQWLEQHAKGKGLEKVYCRVRRDTPQNIEFYQHSDYYISKEETIINKDGHVVDTVLMEKTVKVIA